MDFPLAVDLLLLDPLEPVFVVPFGVIFAVMSGAGFLAHQGRIEAQLGKEHRGRGLEQLGEFVRISRSQICLLYTSHLRVMNHSEMNLDQP